VIDIVPPTLARILERELAPGERIIWQARPATSNRMRASLGSFLFGIPLFAFAVIWTLGASGGFASERSSSRSWPPWFPVLWGGMFILLSALMLLSPLWAWWVARHTVYAITDRRAILIEAPFRRTTFIPAVVASPFDWPGFIAPEPRRSSTTWTNSKMTAKANRARHRVAPILASSPREKGFLREKFDLVGAGQKCRFYGSSPFHS
jgi:hypothetical protein